MCEHKALVSVGVGMVILCQSTPYRSLSSASCILQTHDGAGSTPGAVGPRSMANVAAATLPGGDTCCLAVVVGAGAGASLQSPCPPSHS